MVDPRRGNGGILKAIYGELNLGGTSPGDAEAKGDVEVRLIPSNKNRVRGSGAGKGN